MKSFTYNLTIVANSDGRRYRTVSTIVDDHEIKRTNRLSKPQHAVLIDTLESELNCLLLEDSIKI